MSRCFAGAKKRKKRTYRDEQVFTVGPRDFFFFAHRGVLECPFEKALEDLP